MNIRLSAARKTIMALLATFCVLFLTLGVVSLNSNSSQTLSASAETTAYTSVSDADGLSTAVATDGYYQLTADITGITSSVTIASGNTITLDLNGHTLSFSDSAYINNYGTFTLEDSSGDNSGKLSGTYYGIFVAAATSDSGLSEHQIAQASVLVGGTAAIMVVLALAAFTIVKAVSGKKRRRA